MKTRFSVSRNKNFPKKSLSRAGSRIGDAKGKKKKSKSAPSLTPCHPVERAKNRRLTSGNSSKTTNPRDGGRLVGVQGAEVEDIGDDTYEGREQARTPLLRHRHARDHRPQAARTRNDERGRREREGWGEEEEEEEA